MAYMLLPHYAYQDFGKIVDLWTTTPASAGPFLYLMVCQYHRIEPSPDDATRFRVHQGNLSDGKIYYALEYPVPPPVDLANIDLADAVDGEPPILAPHFSAVVVNESSLKVSYYVLGQAPLGGGTTMRSVTAEGANCNHGPGPEPRLDRFLARIVDPRA
jgi:hypothetical protein